MSCLREIEQPPHWDHTAPDGAYFNRMLLRDANSVVPQHSHTEAHTTLIVRGALRAWRDGKLLGDFCAPHAIYIPAWIKHTFMSLEQDTEAWCIFRESPVTHEEHQLERVA